MQILTLGLTTAMFWVGGRMMKSVLNPPSEGAARARKRVATMLGIDPSRLVLNTYEATLSTCVFDPQHLGVSIADVAGLDHLVEHLCASVKFMRAFPNAGGTSMLASSKGLLLYGPPGTGKTMVAKVRRPDHVGYARPLDQQLRTNKLTVSRPSRTNTGAGKPERVGLHNNCSTDAFPAAPQRCCQH